VHRLLIFDLDGTLIDSAADIVTTVNTLMDQRGRPQLPTEEIVASIGEGLRALVYNLFPESHVDAKFQAQLEAEFQEVYGKNLLLQTRVFAGVTEFLRKWPHTIAIVTNKNEVFAHQLAHNLDGLKQFQWLRVFGADSLPERKPHPLPLQEVMRIAGVTCAETVMIGDGTPDMRAAEAAGVHSVAIEFGYTAIDKLRAAGASASLASYADLPRILQSLTRLPPRLPKVQAHESST
jgi:2-phosphoglycolate phosphatase